MKYEVFKLFKPYEAVLEHGFTHRDGGVSNTPFGTQHMGILSSHYQEEAWQNIVHLAGALNTPVEGIVMTEQIHKDHLHLFKTQEMVPTIRDGQHVYVLGGTDGVFTQALNTLLLTFYADCTPIYFYDPKHQAIGMTHSGWRGTAQGIGPKGVAFMRAHFGSEPADLRVVIGPSAGHCCYEVDELVKQAFIGYEPYFEASREGHYFMNLKGINQALLEAAGVLPENIEVAQGCTLCNTNTYFSHRQEQGKTGRMAAFMMIKA